MTPLPNPFMSETAATPTPICPKCKLPAWGIAWCANQPCPSGYQSYEQSQRPESAAFVLDVEAFCGAIDPPPLFLQRTRS
jgi:hypothetical protein